MRDSTAPKAFGMGIEKFINDMPETTHYIGKLLIILGVVLAAVGALFMLSDKVPWLGRLPGDILVRRKNFTFYFPVATSILISIILTLLLWLFGRK